MQALGRVQQGSGEGSGEGSGSQVRFNRASRRFRRRFRRRFEEALDAKPSQVQRVARKVAEAKPGQGHLTPGILAEVFPALGFAARFRKICKK